MSKKRFNREASLEQDEVILDEVQEAPEEVVQVDQAFTEREQAPTGEPTKEEVAFAKQLTGSPQHFDQASVALIAACVAKGLAADFGAEGYARGFKWHLHCKRS